jgi:hypothetical protein
MISLDYSEYESPSLLAQGIQLFHQMHPNHSITQLLLMSDIDFPAHLAKKFHIQAIAYPSLNASITCKYSWDHRYWVALVLALWRSNVRH